MIQQTTQRDPSLSSVMEHIKQGWPGSPRDGAGTIPREEGQAHHTRWLPDVGLTGI